MEVRELWMIESHSLYRHERTMVDESKSSLCVCLVCVFVCVCTNQSYWERMYVCMWMCVSECIPIHMCICLSKVYDSEHVCVCACACCACVCVHVCVCVCCTTENLQPEGSWQNGPQPAGPLAGSGGGRGRHTKSVSAKQRFDQYAYCVWVCVSALVIAA